MNPGRAGILTTLAATLAATALLCAPAAPVAAGSSARARGAELFVQSGCEHCHGVNGAGTERAPDLLRVRKRLSSDAIFRQIHDGGREMPAFGDELQPAQIHDLVAYLRSRRSAPSVPPHPRTVVAGLQLGEASAVAVGKD